MRAAIYARVSTSGNGQNPEMQLRELREYCVRRGLEIAGEYVDAGVSGAKEHRPQLDTLVARLRVLLVFGPEEPPMAKEWKTFADARKTMTELLQGAFAVGFVAGFQQGKVAGGDPTEINLEKKLWRMGKAEAKKCDLTRFGD